MDSDHSEPKNSRSSDPEKKTKTKKHHHLTWELIRWPDTRKTRFTTYQVAKGWSHCAGEQEKQGCHISRPAIRGECTTWERALDLRAALWSRTGPNAAGARQPVTPNGSYICLPSFWSFHSIVQPLNSPRKKCKRGFRLCHSVLRTTLSH